jgi:hypothetical protein
MRGQFVAFLLPIYDHAFTMEWWRMSEPFATDEGKLSRSNFMSLADRYPQQMGEVQHVLMTRRTDPPDVQLRDHSCVNLVNAIIVDDMQNASPYSLSQPDDTMALALGTLWEPVGIDCPTTGAEISDDALSTALLTRHAFSADEVKAFGIEDLAVHSFIKVQYRPERVINGKSCSAEYYQLAGVRHAARGRDNLLSALVDSVGDHEGGTLAITLKSGELESFLPVAYLKPFSDVHSATHQAQMEAEKATSRLRLKRDSLTFIEAGVKLARADEKRSKLSRQAYSAMMARRTAIVSTELPQCETTVQNSETVSGTPRSTHVAAA